MSATLHEQLGNWVVDVSQSNFCDIGVVKHGLGGPVVLLARQQHGGYRAHGFVHMSHQTYGKKVEEMLEENSSITEVVAMDTETGDWRSIWVKSGHEPEYDN